MYLYEQHCVPGNKPQLLNKEQIKQCLQEVPDWNLIAESTANNAVQKTLSRSFKFKNYHQTLQFINAIAPLIHKENHHPDINFGYNTCAIHFSTHSAAGITIFDFICAAHIDKIFIQQGFSE